MSDVVVVIRPGVEHQETHCSAMAEGISRHGHRVTRVAPGQRIDADVAVCWGWQIGKRYRNPLVLERGHVGPRRTYTSAGWRGLAGYGHYPGCLDSGERWESRHGALMQPWHGGGYALLLGQCAGDAALHGLDFRAWAQRTTDELLAAGLMVRYRPHPAMAADRFCPTGATLAGGGLQEALARAELAVTYTSTAGVEAVLSGVPTLTFDRGAMAWPVTGHAVGEVVTPDRTAWSHALAWTQWTIDELASGEAWAALSPYQ